MIRIIAFAIRDRIRSALELNDNQCDITEGGLPYSISPHLFVGLSNPGFSPGQDVELGVSEVYNVGIVVSIRCADIPRDRRRDIYLDPVSGVQTVTREVIRAIHNSWELIAAINSQTAQNGLTLVTPFVYTGASEPESRDGTHWVGSSAVDRAGAAQSLSFGGATGYGYLVDLEKT
jgi:hypothetical protein